MEATDVLVHHTPYRSRRGSDDSQSYFHSSRASVTSTSSTRTVTRTRALETSKPSSPSTPDVFSPEWDTGSVDIRDAGYDEGQETWGELDHVINYQQCPTWRTSTIGRRGSASSDDSIASLIASSSFSLSPPNSMPNTPSGPRAAHHFPSTEIAEMPAATLHVQASRQDLTRRPAKWRASVTNDAHLVPQTEEDECIPKPGRSKVSIVLRSLNLSLSRRDESTSSPRSPPVSPSKRLAPISRYNPFIRARSESLSSVIEEERPVVYAMGEFAELVRPRSRSTTSSSLTPRTALPGKMFV